MDYSDLKEKFGVLRNLLTQGAQQHPKDANAQKEAALAVLGLAILESTLFDVKRIADALDQIVMNTQQRP